MAEPSADQLLRQAVKQTRQGDLPKARKLIQAAIRKDSDNPTAWLVYASIAETKREKLLSLKKTLELAPDNTQAQKMIRDMGIDPAKLTGKRPAVRGEADTPGRPPSELDPTDEDEDDTPDYLTYQEATVAPPPEEIDAETEAATDEESAEPAIPDRDPGEVPIPPPRAETFEQRLALATEEADRIALDFLEPPAQPPGVEWVKKEENRAGENEILVVRAALATSITVFVAIPLIVLGTFIYNTPFFQGLISEEERVSGLQTLTPTPTPPTTPTNTPGFTPTPSQTASPIPTNQVAAVPTLTPTPTVDSFIRQGDPNISNIRPTDIVLPGGVANRAVRDGLVLINEGNEDIAIATLQASRGDVEDATTFNAESALTFYTEALALARQGNGEEALELLEDGEALRQEFTRAEDVTSLAAIRAGQAEAHLAVGRAQQARGATGAAAQSFTLAERNAEEAINASSGWPPPYLTLIESQIARGLYAQAENSIERAQNVQGFQDDVRFIIKRGEIAFAQEDYEAAAYHAFVAHYADPISAAAHDLRTRVAVARGNISDASLYAQEYLYYHPLVVEGWELLGEIRLMEGNTNLALEAFTQAITVGENTDQPPAVDAYVARADIYERRGLLEQARADIQAAAAATENPDLLRRQLELTLDTGDETAARQLADQLEEDGVISGSEAAYVEARLLARRDALTEGDYAQIARLIDGNFGALPADWQPTANRLRGEAYLQQGNAETALNYIDSALAAAETPRLRLLRAQALEAAGRYEEATLAYEQVLTLNQLVPVDGAILEAARGGRRSAENLLQQEREFATATAQAR